MMILIGHHELSGKDKFEILKHFLSPFFLFIFLFLRSFFALQEMG
jgi:hypothetical protein